MDYSIWGMRGLGVLKRSVRSLTPIYRGEKRSELKEWQLEWRENIFRMYDKI